MADDLMRNQGLEGVPFFEKFYENVYDMYPELLEFKPRNMTDLLTTIVMNKEIDTIVGRADTLKVYFSVLHLQDEGFSLGQISRMSKEQMIDLLEEGFNLETIAIRMTDDLIDQSGLGKLRTQENLVEMATDLTDPT